MVVKLCILIYWSKLVLRSNHKIQRYWTNRILLTFPKIDLFKEKKSWTKDGEQYRHFQVLIQYQQMLHYWYPYTTEVSHMNYRLDHKALFICSVNSCCIILIFVQLSSPQLSPIQLFFAYNLVFIVLPTLLFLPWNWTRGFYRFPI